MVARRWPNHFPFSAGIFLQAWAGRKEEVEHGKTIGRPPTFISFLKRKKKCWGDHEFLLCAHLGWPYEKLDDESQPMVIFF